MALIKKKGTECFQNKFLPKFGNTTTTGLLLTLVIVFAFQGETIINNPIHILLIAVPLTIQTFLIFFIAYGACKKLKLTHDIAAPAGMIGASNVFELSVAVAIAVFGTDRPLSWQRQSAFWSRCRQCFCPSESPTAQSTASLRSRKRLAQSFANVVLSSFSLRGFLRRGMI